MSYTLYFNPDSANLVVRMVLEELGVAYDDRKVARRRTERSADFFELNPRGLLPVLIDQETGAPIFETAAILLYLADKHGRLAPSPSALEARGACLRWLFMLSNTLHADLAIQFYAERYVDSADDAPIVQKAAARRAFGHLEMLNERLEQATTEWVLPSGLSVCDFYVACCLRWAQIYPEEGARLSPAELSSLSALEALLRRLEQRPSVQTAFQKESLPEPAFIGPTSPLPPRASGGPGAA